MGSLVLAAVTTSHAATVQDMVAEPSGSSCRAALGAINRFSEPSAVQRFCATARGQP
jgi:hypothetical protein